MVLHGKQMLLRREGRRHHHRGANWSFYP